MRMVDLQGMSVVEPDHGPAIHALADDGTAGSFGNGDAEIDRDVPATLHEGKVPDRVDALPPLLAHAWDGPCARRGPSSPPHAPPLPAHLWLRLSAKLR